MSPRDRFEPIYDSARAVATVGVRGFASADRVLVYRAGPLTIDLVSSGRPCGGPLFLHGQVVREHDQAPLAGIAVNCPGAPAPTETDPYGQFALLLESGWGRPSEVAVAAPDGALVLDVPDTGN